MDLYKQIEVFQFQWAVGPMGRWADGPKSRWTDGPMGRTAIVLIGLMQAN